ncbi:MAG TPA: glycerophosphodiester phosphodiesterase family protein [Reyranellaceae bacterium]|nr:glycerophosphodiester phosphodiesterase family protein [Reyranellaceae bacterium]
MLQLPKVIGHRGAMAYRPENTLASFREARKRGATWIEIDVKLTADGVPIVMHDESLKRTMGVDRLVAQTPRAELPRDVPTFEETMALCGELGLGCNVELKPCKGREAETGRVAVEALSRHWPRHLPPPLLSSFKDASLLAARAAAPQYARALLVSEAKEDWRARAEAVEAAGMNVGSKRLTAATAVAIKRAGYALSVWTVNDPDEAKALVGMGADCIITDAPDIVIAALGN